VLKSFYETLEQLGCKIPNTIPGYTTRANLCKLREAVQPWWFSTDMAREELDADTATMIDRIKSIISSS